MKLVKSLLLVTTLGMASTAVLADDHAGSGPNPFTDCGIGASLFPDTHWAAVTSNIIWDVGTTAITSATASPETCNGKSVEVAKFISNSYDNLVEDTAKGQGQHLTAMLDMYGCDASAQVSVINSIRPQVGTEVNSKDFTTQTKGEKAHNYYNIVNSVAVSSCSA